jgi:hypothetical protein
MLAPHDPHRRALHKTVRPSAARWHNGDRLAKVAFFGKTGKTGRDNTNLPALSFGFRLKLCALRGHAFSTALRSKGAEPRTAVYNQCHDVDWDAPRPHSIIERDRKPFRTKQESYDMAEEKQAYGEIGSKLLFENDRVRVWDLHLAPGESTGMHAHHCDYLYVVIGDGELAAMNPDGSELHRGTMRDGEVHFRAIDDQPAVHEAFNVGQTPWRNIIVELKDKPAR